jgi:predicted phosphoribosyltransferase/dienelactone hydrolase
MVTLPFRNRIDAARQLALALDRYRGSHPVVLAIPRGAVPMGKVIADALGGELDVILVKKIGAPGNPEVAIGSVDEQGNLALNENNAWFGAGAQYIRAEADRQLAAMRERRRSYRGSAAPVALQGRTAIVVDDGLATGATMAAALKSARRQGAARVVCAVPVAAPEALAGVEELADDTVCLATPVPFRAVGRFYLDFSQVDDASVVEALGGNGSTTNRGYAPVAKIATSVPFDGGHLDADLVVPGDARGLVVFAHGSGSSRLSRRNQSVARSLNQRGFATLLFDLLTPRESDDPEARFNIPLLARRLHAAVDWAQREPRVAGLPIGLFGASTGAAATLLVAAADPERIAAVVSRGGRPDLAGERALRRVRAPTLLIVGGEDHAVLDLNRAVRELMGDVAQLAIHPGATHLFEELGALERVAALAGDWFARWLPVPSSRRSATG